MKKKDGKLYYNYKLLMSNILSKTFSSFWLWYEMELYLSYFNAEIKMSLKANLDSHLQIKIIYVLITNHSYKPHIWKVVTAQKNRQETIYNM